MIDDFTMLSYKLPSDLKNVRIYPLGDLHIGSPQFSEKVWTSWKQKVMDDTNGYVIIVGDLGDYGLKTSKTNCYEATMTPREQKDWLTDELRPLAPKILGATDGNHEYRLTNATSDSPMYDVLARLGIEDVYRQNIGFIKVNLGKRKADRQCSYSIAITHGASRNKVDKFTPHIDGIDLFVSGHTHDPSNSFPAKIVVDNHNECVYFKGYSQIVVPSMLDLGGYGIRGLYTPKDNTKTPIIILNGEKKEVDILWKTLM